MYSQNVFAGFLIAMVSLTFCGSVAAQGTWAVEKTFRIGGEGGWDYVSADAKNHRLYVPRNTHTMVIDAVSGKTIADIPVSVPSTAFVADSSWSFPVTVEC